MQAKIVYYNSIRDEEIIECNGHRLQFGGPAGDTYCYSHQSFQCIEELNSEERDAIYNMEPLENTNMQQEKGVTPIVTGWNQ